VKFAKNGSDVTTAAVKLARAYTGRDLVAICADHPFFSVDDWFIGSTIINSGIPAAIQDLTVKFHYNDIASVESLFEKHAGRIACLILEPVTVDEPICNYLQEVKDLCRRNGAIFIFDEMITGFRLHIGGGQKYYGVIPDLSTFGKAMGNGFSIAALVGKREFMERGGLQHEKERVFLLSTTHGAETHALAAAKETITIYQREQVVEHLRIQGDRLKKGIDQSAEENRVAKYFQVVGKPCNLVYATRDESGDRSNAFRTLVLQELIKRGVLAPSLVVSYSHTNADIDKTIEVFHEALHLYRKALDEGIGKYLEGRPVKPVYRKFN